MFSSFKKNIPNILSGLRLCFAMPLVYALYNENTFLAMAILLTGAVTDWADGFIARRYNLQSTAGAWLDALADKVILNSTFMTLACMAILPMWMTIPLLIRDILIIAGAFAVYKVEHRIQGKAGFLGKISTFLQFCLVIWCVFMPDLNIPFSVIVGVLTVTLLSGLHYVDIWSRWSYKSYKYSEK